MLPVIDGLDELPGTAPAAVLTALNEALDDPAPVVVTCRTDAYSSAAAAAGPLTGAAVVEPAPVDAADALTSLRAERPDRWGGLASHVEQQPHGTVAEALTSPLMVALARTVYADGDADPAELEDLPTREAVEDHLLDALVPTLYARAQRQDPGRPRPWSPERAHR
ncbi:hypothetical protein [Streptomyces sp. NPDC000229]|uniref:hypothetical protein n=1 Tax=Streptomyces sp. NPDC000229 TaxID=3154247 RepID=UPI00332B91D3